LIELVHVQPYRIAEIGLGIFVIVVDRGIPHGGSPPQVKEKAFRSVPLLKLYHILLGKEHTIHSNPSRCQRAGVVLVNRETKCQVRF
jgi:hypothetical protein